MSNRRSIVLLAALALVGALVWIGLDRLRNLDQQGGATSGIWPAGSVYDVAGLRDRDDLNVLFILIDTLRADRLGAWGL